VAALAGVCRSFHRVHEGRSTGSTGRSNRALHGDHGRPAAHGRGRPLSYTRPAGDAPYIEACSSLDLRRLATSAQNCTNMHNLPVLARRAVDNARSAVSRCRRASPNRSFFLSVSLSPALSRFLPFSLSVFLFLPLSLPPCLPTLPFSLPITLFPSPSLPSLSPLLSCLSCTCSLSLFLYGSIQPLKLTLS